MSLAGVETAIVLARLELGGAGRQALLLGQHLRDVEGARVRVVGLGEEIVGFARPGRVAIWCEEQGIPWHRLSERPLPATPWAKLALLFDMVAFLRRWRVELVLPYTAAPNFYSGLAWRFTSARACIWSQRVFQPESRPRIGQRVAARSCSALVSNTGAGAQFLVDRLGVPADRVHHVPNGVRLDPPRLPGSAWRERLGIAPNAFVVVCQGQMHTYEKDPDTVLRAWNRLSEEGFDGYLIVAGGLEPDRASDLERIAAPTSPRVLFTGEIDDISGLLEAADVGVFSSRFEGLPNAVLEFMYAGLPVVAVDLPGTREALGPEQVRALLAPGDVGGFAARLRELAGSRDERRRLGEENYRRARVEFGSERMVAETTAIIRKALSAR